MAAESQEKDAVCMHVSTLCVCDANEVG